jgi:aryl-alcohol dehydrogenase-like predicted oxidoreductase
LGSTDLRASPLAVAGGYGLDATGVERAFHELGINTFFVAATQTPIQEGLRRLVKAGHRDQLVIISGAKFPLGISVPREHEKMARTLGVEVIDVFLLFWVQAHWYVSGKTWPAMRRLKEAGKVRALGISIHDRKMARALLDELQLDAMMLRYNAAHRGAEQEIFSTLPAQKPAIIAYTATRWGKLLEPKGGLGPMRPEECYRFQLSHPSVDVALSGAGSFEELEANARGVALGPLDGVRLTEVRSFGDAVRRGVAGAIF